ncbi:unnamed protein product, partial [Symbiodinium microadriaticum]
MAIFPTDAVRRDEAVGLFTVAKNHLHDRLIVNPAVLNSRMATLTKTQTLASGSRFTLMSRGPDEVLRLSRDDLREFYHTFIVSSARARRNCIGVRFQARELRSFRAFDPAKHEGRRLYLALRTLAMGDSLAVELAQEAHLRLEETVNCPFYEFLAIDDHIEAMKAVLWLLEAGNAFEALGLRPKPTPSARLRRRFLR